MVSVARTTRFRAVVFDLFNTLTPGGSRAERDVVSRRMARLLDVDEQALADLIRRTFDERTRGQLGGVHQTVEWLARRLGAQPTRADVEAAVELRLSLTRSLLDRTWALRTLRELGEAGVLRAVVSDCSAETPALWPQCALAAHVDSVSFSCVTGFRKPDPRAFVVALEALGLEPHECLFVGDGGSDELRGASSLGMGAVRFLAETEEGTVDSLDAGTAWAGETITDLAEVPRLLE